MKHVPGMLVTALQLCHPLYGLVGSPFNQIFIRREKIIIHPIVINIYRLPSLQSTVTGNPVTVDLNILM